VPGRCHERPDADLVEAGRLENGVGVGRIGYAFRTRLDDRLARFRDSELAGIT
jgi:hypothetical protein